MAYAITPFPSQPAERPRCDGVARFRCPRCQGTTALQVTDAAPAKGAAPASALPNLVECHCGQPHAGRPENAPAWGCGGFWNELDG